MFRAIVFVLLVKLIGDAAGATPGGLFNVRISIEKYISKNLDVIAERCA